jgi:hypothetical protein
MYIQGHIDIVQEIFNDNNFNKMFFDLEKKYQNVNFTNIIKGIQMLDLPCAKYDVDTENRKIVLTKHKICRTIKLYKILFNNESSMFQFHKGYFLHLHAMTTDPENTMLKIRNKILTSIMGYCLLAVYDDTLFDKDNRVFRPNSIWIGMIIHILTDSYSPSHTIRVGDGIKIIKKAKKTKNASTLKQIEIHDHLKHLAKDEKTFFKDKESFIKRMKEDVLDDKDEMYNSEKILWKMYKVFRFEYDMQRVLKKWMKNIDHEVDHEVESIGDVIMFQPYSEQSHVTHGYYDLLYHIKNKPELYGRMKNECKQFILLYQNVLKTRDVSRFLKNTFAFMINGPFKIHKKHLNKKTDSFISLDLLNGINIS